MFRVVRAVRSVTSCWAEDDTMNISVISTRMMYLFMLCKLVVLVLILLSDFDDLSFDFYFIGSYSSDAFNTLASIGKYEKRGCQNPSVVKSIPDARFFLFKELPSLSSQEMAKEETPDANVIQIQSINDIPKH